MIPLALGAATRISGTPARASGGWQYQIGVSPDSGINYATHTYAQTVYRTTYGITAPSGDSSYVVSYWIGGDDADYPYNSGTQTGNFYQVGVIDYPASNYAWIFIQTTIPSSDGQGGTYMYCETSRGATLGNGALGQPNAGCYVPASTYLTPNQYVEFEIYTSSDPAYGSNGPTYGCNGNTHFAVAGVEIGHFADCSNYDGIIDNNPLVVEPSDSSVPVTNNQCSGPSCYSAANSLTDFHAIVGGGNRAAASLQSYCYNPNGGGVPSGAGEVIYNHDSAYITTNGGSCSAFSNQAVTRPGSTTPGGAATSTPQPLRTPPPGASPTPVGGVAAAASRPHPAPNSVYPPAPATPLPRPDISHAIAPTASPTPPPSSTH